MLKVGFAGCWHANASAARNALNSFKARGITTVVQTGDFLYDYPYATKFLKAVETQCEKLDMTVVVVRGNHDNPEVYRKFVRETNASKRLGTEYGDDFARITPHVLHAPDGLRWTWEGVTFGALGGARSIDWRQRTLGESWWLDEVTSPAALESMANGGPLDVLVMHDVPYEVPLYFADRASMPSFWDLQAAEEHRKPLQTVVDTVKPKFAISGHMHAKQVLDVVSWRGAEFTSVILSRSDDLNAKITKSMCALTLDDGKVTLDTFE